MRDALFMGRLTASATHELQNILATIRESSGLMEMCIRDRGRGAPARGPGRRQRRGPELTRPAWSAPGRCSPGRSRTAHSLLSY